jgi:hypothetical protein
MVLKFQGSELVPLQFDLDCFNMLLCLKHFIADKEGANDSDCRYKQEPH